MSLDTDGDIKSKAIAHLVGISIIMFTDAILMSRKYRDY